jgi:hypothetical protein
MNNRFRFLALTAVLFAMAGCSPAVRQGPPAPVVGPGSTGAAPPPASSGNVTVTPLKAPEIQAVEQTPVRTYGSESAAPIQAAPEAAGTPAAAVPPPAATANEQVAMVTPSRPMSKAVRTLLQQAELQRSSGDLTGAAATLERALRIEPDSAYVWNRLAHVRAQQGQAGLAAELAAKSSSFAGTDETLKRDNDRLIAQARQ